MAPGRAIPLVTLTLPQGGRLWFEEALGRVLCSTGFRAGRLFAEVAGTPGFIWAKDKAAVTRAVAHDPRRGFALVDRMEALAGGLRHLQNFGLCLQRLGPAPHYGT